MKFPCILSKRRSEEGKRIRRMFKNDIGVPYQACKQYQLNRSGVCDCLTTFYGTDNNIINMTRKSMEPTLTYHPNPTKEDLLEYFSQRIRVRKMTPKEALRLMDFSEENINKIMNAEIKTTLKNGTVKVKKMPKTQLFKQAGNSIVCSCIYHIGRTLWIPNQKENETRTNEQLSLFD